MKLIGILNEKEIMLLNSYEFKTETFKQILKKIQWRISQIVDFAYLVLDAEGNTECTAQDMQNLFNEKRMLLIIKNKLEKAEQMDNAYKKQIAQNIINLTQVKQ